MGGGGGGGGGGGMDIFWNCSIYYILFIGTAVLTQSFRKQYHKLIFLASFFVFLLVCLLFSPMSLYKPIQKKTQSTSPHARNACGRHNSEHSSTQYICIFLQQHKVSKPDHTDH